MEGIVIALMVATAVIVVGFIGFIIYLMFY
jgi:preprotein translocase subunit Sss1